MASRDSSEKDPSGPSSTIGASSRMKLTLGQLFSLIGSVVVAAIFGYASYRDLKEDNRDMKWRMTRVEKALGIDDDAVPASRPALAEPRRNTANDVASGTSGSGSGGQ
jgi:hypothetical protein